MSHSTCLHPNWPMPSEAANEWLKRHDARKK
jgi:hypothetical protein